MNNVSLAELWPVMEEQINMGKTVQFGPKGTSMMPLIRQGIDSIVLKKAPDKLKKYDLPLYRRDDGHFVLHRVVGIEKDGYVMCGDNQYTYEHGITDAHILAIAVGLYRGDKYVSFDEKDYIIYSRKRVSAQARKRMVSIFKKRVVSFMQMLHIHGFYKKIKKIAKKVLTKGKK